MSRRRTGRTGGRSRQLVIPVVLGALLGPLPAAGQQPCPEGRVARVRIQTQGVFSDSSNGMMSRFGRLMDWLHVDTRERVIRRELLLREGDCFDGLRLSESERLLRELRFLREATIRASRRSDGDVNLAVVTADDWSLRVEPELDFGGGLGFNGVRLGEMNLWGTGSSLELFYLDRPGRDEFGLSHFHPQLGRTRWDLDVTASRTEPGWFVRGLVSYPFVGLVGRWVALQELSFGERWFRFVPGDFLTRHELVLPFTRFSMQLGGALRSSAAPSRTAPKLATYGASLSYERLTYDRAFFGDSMVPVLTGMDEDTANQALLGEVSSRRTLRFNVLGGMQALKYVKRRAVTTLQATEDLPLGVATDVVLGVTSRSLGSTESRLILGLDADGTSIPLADWLSGVGVSFEASRDFATGEWRDVFGAAEWSNYWFSGGGHTLELRVRAAGGWRTTVPFQLTLGGSDGLRGYGSHRFPGGARGIITVEDRAHFWSAGRLFDLGAAFFVDVGRVWANDVAFGTDSGLRASAGTGLRVAAPTGSRLTYRLDLGVPIERHVRWEDLTLTLRIRRPFDTSNGVVDLEMERSRDLPLRTAVRHLK